METNNNEELLCTPYEELDDLYENNYDLYVKELLQHKEDLVLLEARTLLEEIFPGLTRLPLVS